MKYIYQARSKEGKMETGTVEASSKEAAAVLLQKYNIFVTAIKEDAPSILRPESLAFMSKVSKKDLAIFSRQLSIMLQSRVPVVQSLSSLAIQTENQSFKEKIVKISQLIEEGNPLSQAFSAFPEVFDEFYISLIKTGEASGKITESLTYLSDHLEREHDIAAQIKGALIYPALVIVVLSAVILIVMFFLMPRLVDLLQQASREPPFFTMLMLNFYQFLQHYGLIIIAGFFFLILFLVFYFSTKEGRKVYDKIILEIPFVGGFFKKMFLIRFAESVATLVTAGLSVNNALKISRNSVNNHLYKELLIEIENKVSDGEKISSVLVNHPKLVPPFVVQMVQVGEETGRLGKNLMEIVNFYQKEIDRAVATFTALLEPGLIIVLGIVVAIIAVSVIEPLYGSLGAI
jgi:type IV pilus assembly protein PilC